MLEATMRRTSWLLGAALAALLATPAAARAATEIKIATVAPEGSAWMRIFNKMKAAIDQRTGGAVKLHFYAGQSQGDERDVVRKIGTGQLHGGSFTAVGLSMINPKVLVLQMPLLFTSYASLDKVRTAMKAEFEQSFREKGYEILGWGDVGWVYLFTKEPVTSKADLKKQRVWVWNDDPISKAMMRASDVKPRLLGLPQVYPALNTGMVNAVYNAPLAALTLQWHTQVKHYSDFPLAIAIGATVVSKKVFDSLSAEHQKLVKEIAEKSHAQLNKRVRSDNEKALAQLKQLGIKAVDVPEASKKEFRDVAARVAQEFAPRYYSKALLDKVKKLR
jgi:TRAP-type C4-dicarboxylate transport system substrate-binding protein